jgi:hypothetical protein
MPLFCRELSYAAEPVNLCEWPVLILDPSALLGN